MVYEKHGCRYPASRKPDGGYYPDFLRSGIIATPKASPLVELCRRKWRARVHHSPFPTQRGESCRCAPTSPTRAPPPRGHEVPLLSVAHSPLPVLVQRASMGNVCGTTSGAAPWPPSTARRIHRTSVPLRDPEGPFGASQAGRSAARSFPTPIWENWGFTARARSAAGPPRTEECAADPSADLSTTTPPGSIRPGPTLPHACGAR